MKTIVYNKLVRDRVPEILISKGHVPLMRVLAQPEYVHYLKQKILEEASEVVQATSRDAFLTELTDLLEVIESLTIASGITLDQLKEQQKSRRLARGGFEKRIFLEKVDEN
jgi:predicted house-cleaning noncanonical NTP pyrophosphatase (MazG superfamily)